LLFQLQSPLPALSLLPATLLAVAIAPFISIANAIPCPTPLLPSPLPLPPLP
jgi:hypothetical protein